MRPTWPRIVVLVTVVLGGGFAAGLTLRTRFDKGVSPGLPLVEPVTNSYRSGPWGDMRVTRIVTEPLESAAAALIPTDPTRWVFPQQSPVGVERIMTEAGLSEALVREISTEVLWDPVAGASVVTPKASSVLAIPPKARAALYAELGRFPINQYQDKPFRSRQKTADQWFESSTLQPGTIAILRQLQYTRGDTVFISDVPAACELIASKQEQALMLKALSRTTTLVAELAIKPDSDVNALTNYWGFGKRLRNVRPVLESLTRVQGGIHFDITHLLPRFARKRLYAYPARDGKVLDPPFDCHWSSFNFWNDPPDNRLSDTEYVVHLVMTEYTKIPEGKWRFGDVLLLGLSENELIHSCVYVAGDIVFTKNGPSHLTPWVLMEMDDLLAYYEMPSRSAMRAYRPNELME